MDNVDVNGQPGPARQRLLLIDGHSMAFRAFYGLPPENFRTGTDQAVNAVYGFVLMLLSLLSNLRPSHVGVAFDVSRITFRTGLYPNYKAQRADTPEDFKGQTDLIKQVLEALRIAHCELPDYEADDIIATWAKAGQRDGYEVLICSGDRDTFQLVDANTTVLYPRRGVSDLAEMTPAAVAEKYFVSPSQYADLAALVGEDSDNLPGVPMVGPKTAAKWLGQYGDLAGIIAHAAELPGKVGQSLRDHIDQVRLNRRLGTPVTDLELPLTPSDLKLRGLDEPAVNQTFDLLEFRQLRQRVLNLDLLAGPDAEPSVNQDFAPDDGPKEPKLVTLAVGGLPDWLADRTGQMIGLEVTGTLDRGEGDAWGLGLAGSDGQVLAYDLAAIDAVDLAALAAWLSDPAAPKVMVDPKLAGHMLAGRGLALAGVEVDIALAAYLCYPDQRSYEVDDLSRRLLGRSLAAPSSQPTLLDLPGADPALAMRAAGALDLVAPLTAELERREASALLRDLEMPLTAILGRMEKTGIALDAVELTELEAGFAFRVQEAKAAALDAIGGRAVNLASPKQLQQVLFTDLGMKPKRRTKTGLSTDAETLAELFAETQHPFLEHLLAHRDAIKLQQMVQTLLKSVGADGRIHATFHQTVAATGRLSSSDPNLQNIPVRSDIGRAIRRSFVVGDGYCDLMTADYSQIEMRIMAHLSGDESLIAAFRSGEDLHRAVAGQVFGMAPADVTSQQRSRIKAMSYGLAYGLSAYGLSRQLAVTPGEAQSLMDEYFKRFGGIRDYLEGVVAQARQTGYTETIMGRRRYLPDLNSDHRHAREMAERMALNAPIQGSAADIIKVAMLNLDRALTEGGLASRLLLQVHDELVLEIAPGEAETVQALVRDSMANAGDLSVPLTVSVGQGPTWEAAAH